MKKRLTMLLACLSVSIGVVLAQGQLSGTVLSSEDGLPVVGASVVAEGTGQGAATNIDGLFTLAVPPGTQLTVSYIGMIPKKVKATPGMKIMLDPDEQMLDEVMVIAFGQAKKSAFTGSAAVVGSEKLAESQVTSVTNALAGAVPGLQLTSNNGDPSSTSTIRIRGFSSLNAGKDPLIIVDGAPYSGDLSNINPSDVESMTVLKDAASNALYGARGANGVIMITTKQAKTGDAKITLDAKWGWNTRALQHYDLVTDPAQYYEMHYEALKNYYISQGYSATEAWQKANANLGSSASNGGLGYICYTVPEGQMLIGQNGKLNPNATLGNIVSYNGTDYLITPDDWEDEAMCTGHRQEYNLSISTATAKSSIFTSLGYLKNEGITAGSDLERFTGRLKADYQAKDWLKVGANVSFAHYNANYLANNGSSSSTGNIWAFTSQIAPIYPLYLRNADGSIMYDSDGIKMLDYGNGMNAGLTRPFLTDANAVQDNLLNTKNREGNAAGASGYLDITFMPGLKLTINGTYNLDETRYKYVYNPYYGQFDTTGGTVSTEHYRTYDYDLQQILNYTATFGTKHNLNVMLGHEYYNYLTYDLYATKSQMFSQDNKELSGAVIDGQGAGGSKSRYNNEGYFGRVMYDYDSRYFGSFSLRRDASSRFHPDHRWGTFWSLGAAWLINKEKWFNASWVDELKVKASIGSQGNDNIDDYLYVDTYTLSNSGGAVGTTFAQKGTEDITWETNTNFNIGTEFALFGKLSGQLEFYHRKTTDMLYAFSVAPSLGYTSYYDNVGDLYNQGFELTLDYNIYHSKDVNVNFTMNIASLRNRITMLHADQKQSTFYTADGKAYDGFVSGYFYIAEDLPMYTWRLKEYAGVDEETGLSMWYKNVYETDANGNSVWAGRETTTTYSDADYYVTEETTIPDFYGGFGLSVQAYGFDLSANFSYQIGGKQYDYSYAEFMSSPISSSTGTNFHKDLLKSWTTDNTSSSIPRFQYGDTNSAAMSTRFLTNASYLNIENINFGYTVPKAITQKFLINSLRIYLACENVAYISARKGFDPRQSYTTVTNATYYSPIRSFSVGLNVEF